MKGLICLAYFWSHCGRKKNLKRTHGINGFFWPVTSFASRLASLTLHTADALSLGFPTFLPDTETSASDFFVARFTDDGCIPVPLLHKLTGTSIIRCRIVRDRSWFLQSIVPYSLAGLLFFQRHYVTEYIMTITNHIRRIEDLANQVIEDVDDREYEKAHCALDDIEAKCHAAHRHIDNLQLVTRRVPVSAGE